MERGSDKHSRLVDEALKHDTQSLVRGNPAEARSQEGREQEGPGEGDPTPDSRLQGERGASPNGMSFDDVNARADLARYLEPSVFPARPGALVASARARFAPDVTVRQLESLPDSTYDTVQEVWVALGGPVEPEMSAGRHFGDPPGMGQASAG